MLKIGNKSGRLGRSLIGILVAYAVAAQSLLIVLGGFSALAQTATAPAFELCHHDAGTPGAPADVPGHPGCSHCIFCFAGSHHAVLGAPAGLFTRLDGAVIEVAPIADRHDLPHLSAYSIAKPRGPPIGA